VFNTGNTGSGESDCKCYFLGDMNKQASGVPTGWIKEFIEGEEDTQMK